MRVYINIHSLFFRVKPLIRVYSQVILVIPTLCLLQVLLNSAVTFPLPAPIAHFSASEPFFSMPIWNHSLTADIIPPHYSVQASHLFFFYLFVWSFVYKLGILLSKLRLHLFLNSALPNNSIPTSAIKFTFGALSSLAFLSVQYLLVSSVLSSTQPYYFSSIWALCYFSHASYILFFFSALLYLLPNMTLFANSNHSSQDVKFLSLEGQDLWKLLSTPLILMLLLHVTWSGPSVTAWFGHIVFSAMQFKITYVLFFFYASYLLSFTLTAHFSSTNVYDFVLVTFNFFVWLWFTFFSNNLFTFIFFIELLSASITLLLVTSTFSSTHFYNSLSFSKHSYFQSSTPTALLQTLLFFFWITLVSSLMLFVLLILFYLRFFSFDWNLTDSILVYLVSMSSIKQLFTLSFVWLLFLVCIFLKCGTVPFYFWKPTFFKGMTMTSLFYYVYIYYFSIFLFFTYVMFLYLNEFFVSNLYLLSMLVVIATLGLSTLLFESFYIKSFLALSSILNSVFIFFAMCSYQSTDLFFAL